MRTVKSMRELRLLRQKLEYQEKLYEKEITESTADIIDNFTDKLRDMAFSFGTHLVFQFIQRRRKHKDAGE
ncbi:MAG TPA: hypothetical protein ENN90_02515 [Mariniphaga anaerophila]|uniref:Uncharacterized protein n=1 Tax=Mariniphaga anaerophila TaxID=1484053 RepID=A0A831PKQ9_9BACT|nr:hypothetical protein [Mariniphaga anaerophila]